MEEFLPVLKGMLEEAIDTTFDETNLLISLKIKPKIQERIADPKEVIKILKKPRFKQ